MKRTILAIFLAISALVLFQCGPSKNWAAKVDGYKVPLEEFNQRFEMYMQMRQQQPGAKPMSVDEERMIKRELLKNMIGEHLIYKELKKEGFDKTKEVVDRLKAATLQLYLEQKFGTDLSVSSLEIEDFYNKNKARLAGLDPEQAQMQIENYLKGQKLQERTISMVDRLYSKARVIQNDAAISPTGMPAMPSVVIPPAVKNEKK